MFDYIFIAVYFNVKYSILVNAPPFGGTLTSNPMSGVSLQDTFLLATSGWTDDPGDLPFQYIFNYYNNRTGYDVLLRGQGSHFKISQYTLLLYLISPFCFVKDQITLSVKVIFHKGLVQIIHL